MAITTYMLRQRIALWLYPGILDEIANRDITIRKGMIERGELCDRLNGEINRLCVENKKYRDELADAQAKLAKAERELEVVKQANKTLGSANRQLEQAVGGSRWHRRHGNR